MEDDFFDNEHTATAAASTFQHENVQIEDVSHQEQGGHIDDFFGGASSNQGYTSSHQEVVHQSDFQEEPADDFFGGGHSNTVVQNSQVTYGETSTPFDNEVSHNYVGFTAADSSPQQMTEQDQRRLRLQKEDQERTEKLIQKQNEEYSKKSSKLSNAKVFLQNWKSEKDQMNQKRKQIALQEEEVSVEARTKVTYRNPWEKITENISLKSSEHPGEKDVTRMKESILNKKTDLLNAKN